MLGSVIFGGAERDVTAGDRLGQGHDANSDGVRNITDVVCSARVTFQDATVCGAHEVALDEIDIAPGAACGDDQLNITDVVAHARAVFQDAIDECCQ